MSIQHKHRNILDAVVPALYESGVKVPMALVPVGSLVIVKFVEPPILDVPEPDVYQVVIVYHHNKKNSRCGETESVYSHFRETGINIEHSHECVILQAAFEPLTKAPTRYNIDGKGLSFEDPIGPWVSYEDHRAAQPSLIYYEVKIESVNYFLRGEARVLANSEQQAKDMAGAKFHQDVQSFMDGYGRHDKEPAKIIDRILLLKDAIYNVKVLAEQPAILNSAWDRNQ